MSKTKAWIFVNGALGSPVQLSSLVNSKDWLVAADGGYHLMKMLNLAPDMVLGDLDSVTEGDLDEIEQAKIPLQRFPVAKDETDLELAINASLARGCRSIRIVGANGGRLDQELGVLFQLLRPDLAAIDIRLEDGTTEAWLIRSEGLVRGAPVALRRGAGGPGGRRRRGRRGPGGRGGFWVGVGGGVLCHRHAQREVRRPIPVRGVGYHRARWQRPPDHAVTGDKSLSDKLSRQQGTLQPPTVDPGIDAPLPSDTRGPMPVTPVICCSWSAGQRCFGSMR